VPVVPEAHARCHSKGSCPGSQFDVVRAGKSPGNPTMVQGAGPDEMTDDWHCLNLAREGDETAWRILFSRYYPSLVRMASCITGSRDTGHDLAQESFIRLLRARIRHQSGSFKAYLTTIVYRMALKEKKWQSSKHQLETVPLADDSPSPLDLAIQNE